jgi:hypothetical protein
VCGGTQRKLIAPGYFECQSDTSFFAPGVTAAGQQILKHHRICSNRYQEGSTVSSLGLCFCQSTLAVGLCIDCRRPVCGVHSDVDMAAGGMRMCVSCRARLATEKQAKLHVAYEEVPLMREDELEGWFRGCLVNIATPGHYQIGEPTTRRLPEFFDSTAVIRALISLKWPREDHIERRERPASGWASLRGRSSGKWDEVKIGERYAFKSGETIYDPMAGFGIGATVPVWIYLNPADPPWQVPSESARVIQLRISKGWYR